MSATVCHSKNKFSAFWQNVVVSVDPKAKAAAAKKAALKGVHSKAKRKIRTNTHFFLPKTLKLARKPKYARKSVPHLPRMDQYRVIRYPLNTETAMKKIEEHNTLTFIVDIKANKNHIKDAVKRLYDVEAAKVNTLIRLASKYTRVLHDKSIVTYITI